MGQELEWEATSYTQKHGQPDIVASTDIFYGLAFIMIVMKPMLHGTFTDFNFYYS